MKITTTANVWANECHPKNKREKLNECQCEHVSACLSTTNSPTVATTARPTTTATRWQQLYLWGPSLDVFATFFLVSPRFLFYSVKKKNWNKFSTFVLQNNVEKKTKTNYNKFWIKKKTGKRFRFLWFFFILMLKKIYIQIYFFWFYFHHGRV